MRQPAPMPAGVPNCVRRWCRVACIVWLAIAATGRAEDVLDVPAACGSRAELERGIAELLGADAGPRAARPTVAMRRAGDEYVLQVQLDEGRRTLRDRDCRALFRAAVLIAALGREALIGLDMADAGVGTGAEAGTATGTATATEAATGTATGAGTEAATGTGTGTGAGAGTAAAPGAGTAPGAGQSTATTARTRAKRGHGTATGPGTAAVTVSDPATATATASDPATATATVPSPGPPSERSPRPRDTRMGTLVSAGLAYGVVPNFTLALGAGAYLERGWIGGRLVASYQLPQSHHDADGGVRSDALGASATLELLATHWLKAGVGGDFYVMHGRGLGVPSARSDWATLGTLHAALGARLYGRGRWAFEALARGLFAPQPARFEVRGGNTLFTTSRFGFQLALGWGWRFL